MNKKQMIIDVLNRAYDNSFGRDFYWVNENYEIPCCSNSYVYKIAKELNIKIKFNGANLIIVRNN